MACITGSHCEPGLRRAGQPDKGLLVGRVGAQRQAGEPRRELGRLVSGDGLAPFDGPVTVLADVAVEDDERGPGDAVGARHRTVAELPHEGLPDGQHLARVQVAQQAEEPDQPGTSRCSQVRATKVRASR